MGAWWVTKFAKLVYFYFTVVNELIMKERLSNNNNIEDNSSMSSERSVNNIKTDKVSRNAHISNNKLVLSVNGGLMKAQDGGKKHSDDSGNDSGNNSMNTGETRRQVSSMIQSARPTVQAA